ncbi:SLC13 family permease [Hyphomicrobium sp.]|uniref:SLC13 family permease n=1 Tax=Hyphomicrobium sp. TaxID=82 RepID=UPI0025C2E2A0|nr:SLC13 family permease [Hyphomicrobium sp.]MCC7250970.1 anion permease [Hyphomicrobium sp.]
MTTALAHRAAVRSVVPWLVFALVLTVSWSVTRGLEVQERLVLVIYAGALAAWCLALSEDWITGALAVLMLAALDVIAIREIVAAARHDLVWLLIAAYVIAFAIRRAGLFEVLSAFALRRSMPVSSLAYRTTALVMATAFVFPATSVRAAILVPIHRMLAKAVDDELTDRAFALLVPSVVLLSAGGVLTGAAAHVVALEIIEKSGGGRIGYLGWMLPALPVALATSFAAAWLVMRLFLDHDRRRRLICASSGTHGRLGAVRVGMLSVVAATVALWMASGWLGIGLAGVGLLSAFCLVLLTSRLQPLAIGDMGRAIDWKLLVLLVSTVLLADAMVASGAAGTIGAGLMAALPHAVLASEAATVALIACLSMLAHVVIPSRSARASVLITAIAVPLSQTGFDIVPLALVIALGTGFCQLTPYGAKSLLIFASGTDSGSFRSDLVRLGAPLFLISWIILVGFALVLWPAIGMFSAAGGNEVGGSAFNP